MDSITSLSRLIEVLKNSDAKNYVAIAKNMNIPASDFEKFAFWKPEGYARNCIIKTPEFELILICWNEVDATPIHCHNEQKCWVYLIAGEMTELRYTSDEACNLTETNNLQMKAGALTYMHDSMGFHLLKNGEEKKAMTLHLYMKPVDSCTVFNDTDKCFDERVLNFHTIDGVKQA